MPFPSFKMPSMGMGIDDLKSYLVEHVRELNYFLSVLDTLNITRLDAKVVIAETITGDKISANTITAEKMNVSQLSAITADMGTLTAGTIIGALIKTALSGQRVELSSTENLLKAINGSGATINIKPNVTGTPAIEFDNGTDLVKFFLSPGTFSLNANSSSTNVTIAAGKNINLNPSGGYYVNIPLWSMLRNSSLGITLQDELDAKANSFSGYTGSVSVVTSVDFAGESTSSSTLYFSNGILTSVS